MQNYFKLIILTPVSKIYDNPVISIIVPAAEGMLGVLAGHAPLVATLTEGDITIKDAKGTKTKIKIKDGFMEVYNNVATLLTEKAELYNN